MKRFVAAALVLTMSGQPFAAASEPVFVSDQPAPATYAALPWKFGDQLTNGYWYSDAQVQKIDLQLKMDEQQVEYLTDKAAKECFDETMAANKKLISGSRGLWIGIGLGIVAGLLGGFFAAKSLKK